MSEKQGMPEVPSVCRLLTVRVDPEMVEQIRAEAERLSAASAGRVSMNSLILKWLREGLERAEVAAKRRAQRAAKAAKGGT